MRTSLIAVVTLLFLTTLQAQQDERSYFGSKAGVNMANIRSGNHFTDGELLNQKLGFAGGLYYHLNITKAISFQPELLYSQMGTEYDSLTSPTLNTPGQVGLNYISVPVLFKVSPLKWLGLFVGPQLDYYAGGIIKYDDDEREDQNLSTGSNTNLAKLSITTGLEIRLFGAIGIYGRYIYGLSDITNGEIEDAFTQGSDLYNDALQFGLSIGIPGKPRAVAAEPEMTTAPAVDTDGDGTPDLNDQCPLIAGLAKYNGCPIPDTDGDAINDEVDTCPSVFGVAKYNGCPIPDTDGDGFNDDVDKCPTQAGTLRFDGCPAPDTDGDGVKDDVDLCPSERGLAIHNGCPPPDSDEDGINDDVDKCPHYPGDAANGGCPDLTIYFANGEPTLTADDKARLDKALEVINDNPSTNFVIEGHASTVGSSELNMRLSQKRADNIKDYFASHGVAAARMTAKGFGETMPVSGPTKAEGDLLSRRVIIKVGQ